MDNEMIKEMGEGEESNERAEREYVIIDIAAG